MEKYKYFYLALIISIKFILIKKVLFKNASGKKVL